MIEYKFISNVWSNLSGVFVVTRFHSASERPRTVADTGRADACIGSAAADQIIDRICRYCSCIFVLGY